MTPCSVFSDTDITFLRFWYKGKYQFCFSLPFDEYDHPMVLIINIIIFLLLFLLFSLLNNYFNPIKYGLFQARVSSVKQSDPGHFLKV